MKLRLLLLCIAALFVSGGILSLIGEELPPPPSGLSSGATGSLTGTKYQASSMPDKMLIHSLSRNQHLMILVRMGLFYGGFICVLLAFDFGTTPSKEDSQSSEA